MRISLRFLPALLLLLLAPSLLAASDIAISLSAPALAPIGGSTSVQVTLAVTGGTSQDVTFLYSIPDGMTFKSLAASAAFTCVTPSAGVDGQISCHAVSISPSAPLTQVINLNVPPTVTGGTTFLHQAGVTSATPDPNNNNDQAFTTQTAQAPPAVQVTSSFPGTFVAGSPLTYNVNLHNSSSTAVQNISFQDQALTAAFGDYFTAGAHLTSGSGFTCASVTSTATTVTCSGGSLAGGGSAVFSVTLQTHPLKYASTIEHKATVTFGDFGTSAVLDETAHGSQGSDVFVTVSAPAQVTAGTNLDFTVTAREAGPSASGSFTLTYAMPAGTAFISLTTSGNSSPAPTCSTPSAGSAGTITCTVHELRPAVPALGQAEVTAGFVARIRAPASPGALTNRVTAAPPNDVNSTNDTASASTTVVSAPVADLAAALQASKTTAVVGSNVTFTATISNAGPAAATNAKGTMTLPAGTTVVSVPNECTSGSTVVCTVASLASGASQAFDVVLTLNTIGTKSSTFTATSDTADSDSSNNTATASVTATPRTSDLGVTVGTSQTSVVTGQPFSVQVIVTASGPDTVDSLLTGHFAPSLQPVSIDSQCTASGTTITCPATMPPGSTVTYNFSFSATAASTYLTTFTVTTTDVDPNPTNNNGTSTVTASVPVTSADVAVSGQAPVAARTGALASYALTIDNRGPADASNVTLTFIPPPSGTLDSFTAPASMTCQQTNVLTCSTATLINGAQTGVTVMVRMGTVAGTKAVATVHVTSSSPEPDPSNNDATFTTYLAGSPFALYVDPPNVNAVQGYAIAYTIRLLNTGATTLQSVNIEDTLPPGMVVISATPSIGSCSGTITLQCHADALDAPGLFAVDVVATTPPLGVYLNHVAAASGAQSTSADQQITVSSTSRRRAAGH